MIHHCIPSESLVNWICSIHLNIMLYISLSFKYSSKYNLFLPFKSVLQVCSIMYKIRVCFLLLLSHFPSLCKYRNKNNKKCSLKLFHNKLWSCQILSAQKSWFWSVAVEISVGKKKSLSDASIFWVSVWYCYSKCFQPWLHDLQVYFFLISEVWTHIPSFPEFKTDF